MNGLLTRAVQPLAVFAKPVPAGTWASFVLGNVSPERARAIVVVDSLPLRLLVLVDRVERRRARHFILFLPPYLRHLIPLKSAVRYLYLMRMLTEPARRGPLTLPEGPLRPNRV
jgi:hypothetical protein